MMARPYCVVVALLLLAEVTRFGEGTPNPEIVAKITRKGLKYARQYGIATLKKELSAIKLPDFSGSFRICLIGNVNYVFSGLRIRRFVLLNSNLRLHTEQGIRASLFNNYVSVSGNWKVQKSFVNLYGTFDLSVDDISISVSLNFGKDQSGQPTASLTHCSNSIGHVSIEISGYLSWILNLFNERIENSFKNILEQKINKRISRFAVNTGSTAHTHLIFGNSLVSEEGCHLNLLNKTFFINDAKANFRAFPTLSDHICYIGI